MTEGKMTEGFTQSVSPIQMLLWCPSCDQRHIDRGEFVTKSHHTHACQHCGMCWRPAVVPTVGVEFLPGFKDEAGSIPIDGGFAKYDFPNSRSWSGPTPMTISEIRITIDLAIRGARHMKNKIEEERLISAAIALIGEDRSCNREDRCVLSYGHEGGCIQKHPTDDGWCVVGSQDD